ncbi:hypothetical protein RJ641_022925, partial [Dillenia turbinata]
MDYRTEIQKNPILSVDQSIYTHSYTTNFTHSLQTLANPNPNISIPSQPSQITHHDHRPSFYSPDSGLDPPGVESYSHSLSSYGGMFAHHGVNSGSVETVCSGYYGQEPNASSVQIRAAKEAIMQFGHNLLPDEQTVAVPLNRVEQLIPVKPTSYTLGSNPAIQPPKRNWWKAAKKTKIVQSAHCEVCKIDCNSKEVLWQHRLGKKHKKNLEKLTEASAPAPSVPVVPKQIIGPQENPEKGNAANASGQKIKKAAQPVEDLETKRKKVIDGGAAANAVRTCAICNV